MSVQPERYGRYVLLEKIGQGGMAEVFRAVARGTQGFQRVLVVKRILPEMSRDPRFVQMFIDEAKICALISHPNVVQVYEFGRLADTHFLTMEYVHGRNLSAVMEKLAVDNELPPADVICEVARQTCLGLHHAHMMTGTDGNPLQIIHRDVTPANIMLGFNGAVKVLDFGIARAAEEVKETKTQAGAVKGKVAYLAPEQIHRRPVDHRIDVFALGVVLHECLTGQRLFKADHPLAAMKAILEMPVPPPSSINAGVTPKVDAIVARALARDPDLRYSSCKAMALDLETALHEMRYFSQRLPNFLRELFKDEVTESKDRILPKELSAISLALAEAEDAAAAKGHEDAPFEDPPSGRGVHDRHDTALPARTSAILLRTLRWVGQSRRRTLGMGLGLGTLLALWAFGVSRRAAPGAAPPPASVIPAAPPPPAEPLLAPTTQISVDSFPQGADIVDTQGTLLGTTPHTLSLDRSASPLDLTLRLEGFESAQLRVIPDIDKPVFAKLEALPVKAKAARRPSPGQRRRASAMPLDPFAE